MVTSVELGMISRESHKDIQGRNLRIPGQPKYPEGLLKPSLTPNKTGCKRQPKILFSAQPSVISNTGIALRMKCVEKSTGDKGCRPDH